MTFFGNLYGQGSMHQPTVTRSGAAQADEAKRIAEDAEARVDKLQLVCMAMWSLLKEKAKLSEADLLERVQDLDLRDGVPDGKVTRQAMECKDCGRVMSPRHHRCMYCGAGKLVRTAFDSLG